MWWLISNVVGHWRCGGSFEMWWVIRDVVSHLICGSTLLMLGLNGDFVDHWRNCGSLRDVVELSSLKTYRTVEPPVADSNPASLTKIPGRGRFITVIL